MLVLRIASLAVLLFGNVLSCRGFYEPGDFVFVKTPDREARYGIFLGPGITEASYNVALIDLYELAPSANPPFRWHYNDRFSYIPSFFPTSVRSGTFISRPRENQPRHRGITPEQLDLLVTAREKHVIARQIHIRLHCFYDRLDFDYSTRHITAARDHFDYYGSPLRSGFGSPLADNRALDYEIDQCRATLKLLEDACAEDNQKKAIKLRRCAESTSENCLSASKSATGKMEQSIVRT